MTRSKKPRGAAAKTEAAIKREAVADKSKARRRSQVEAAFDGEKVAQQIIEAVYPTPPAGWVGPWPPSPKPSILDVAAAATASKRWTFTAEQLADIAEVRAAVRAGKIPHVGAERLARILKDRYALPWSVVSIRQHIKDTP